MHRTVFGQRGVRCAFDRNAAGWHERGIGMKGKRMEQNSIGVIGGSGLYDIEGLTSVRRVQVRTPFGAPSDAITVGTLGGVAVAFLSRHGRGHKLNPSEINYRANIYALKSLGVTRVISVSAVGSMK